MSFRKLRLAVAVVMFGSVLGLIAPPASATPVCTDGYMGGPPLDLCGGRIFPNADNAIDYVQYLPDPATGFSEFQHGIEFLAQTYPRWVQVFKLSDLYGEDAVSMGPDEIRPNEDGDTDDGYEIWVIKLTDNEVPDAGKENLFYSLSVHGDEIGGREGGLRAVEDLAMAAEGGGTITDGVPGYESTTGAEPEFHEYEVAEVLANEIVYFTAFNVDGWVRGDRFDAGGEPNPSLYTRGNWTGTDLNRQMPTVGNINPNRNPLEETEMLYGHQFMHDVAEAGVGGQMAYGADVHGEGQSRAWVDIMYPAGQFDSVKHRRLMAIAERTKSVIDDTLYMGIANEIEEATGGDAGEGIEDSGFPASNTVPTKPARWGTVWDTLGYTDTGFIGDYLATELGVTGMDYEIALNHADTRAYGKPWSYLLQENYFNATRAIIKTAMAYAMTERQDFADFQIDPGGNVGYVFDPHRSTDSDANGSGTLPGPDQNGIGDNGLPVEQRSYSASNLDFFEDESEYVVGGLRKVNPAAIAANENTLKELDTLVLADITAPTDESGASYDEADYFANLRSWVESGGNLVLTDRALHVLGSIGYVPEDAVKDIKVYQPHANFSDFEHPMVEGLRANARQLAEFTLIGFPIGDTASPMTMVDTAAWEAAGGHVVGETTDARDEEDGGVGTGTTVGEGELGKGIIRIMGGGLAIPTEEFDHRYGLKDYALTYSGLFILENSIEHVAPDPSPSPSPSGSGSPSPSPSPSGSGSPSPSPEPEPSASSEPSPSPEPEPSPSLIEQPVADRSVTVEANDDVVKFGKRVRLAGSVAAPDICGAADVRVMRRIGDTMEEVSRTRSNETGSWSATFRAARNAVYRAEILPSGACAGATSDEIYVKVRAVIDSLVTDRRFDAGGCTSVKGRVAPRQAGDSVWLQRKARKGWRWVGTEPLSGRSRFSFPACFGRAGRKILRVRWLGDADNAGAAGGAHRIRVVR
ncbi:MAG: M14 family zinc carboxypeptidase [Actinomycetota bacterium]